MKIPKYLQVVFLRRQKGSEYVKVWYLHYVLDYIKMAPTLSIEEIIKRTEDRFEPCQELEIIKGFVMENSKEILEDCKGGDISDKGRNLSLQERLQSAHEENMPEQVVLLTDLNGFTKRIFKDEGTAAKRQFREYLLEFFERCCSKANLVRADWQLVNVVGDAIILSFPVANELAATFLDAVTVAKLIHKWTREYGLLSVKCAIDVGNLTKICPYRDIPDNSHVLPALYVGDVLNRVSRLLASGRTKKHLRVSQELYNRLPEQFQREFKQSDNIKNYPGKSLAYISKEPLSSLHLFNEASNI
ncbi:MAG: hypothetical protein KAT65_11805, partial [Methanophagales archaeon]|nr:hypothetical protein [Methanophagales archaeon]